MAAPKSKLQTLSGTLTALGGGYTAGICLINNTSAAINYTLGGGDTIQLGANSTIYHPEVADTSELTVSGSGNLHYVLYK